MSIIPQGNENNQECEGRISKLFCLTRSVICFASAEPIKKKVLQSFKHSAICFA